MKPSSLQIEGLRHRYSGRQEDTPGRISFELAPGERALLLGPNGAGKTTLLYRIVGLLRGEGSVRVDGVEVTARALAQVRRGIGFLWQSPDDALLLPIVIEDVALGPVNDGRSPAEARAVAADWLDRLGIARLANRPIDALSLGEKQQVSLAGALAREPGLLLLDEPTASLDAAARERLAALLDRVEATMLLVTHEPEAWLRRTPKWRAIEIAASSG